ncbi:MAG: hypothetical protein IIV49_06910 [Alistipes sp.]|nr:hypothetical protein [Alistipes sp.]MBQ6580817.1 hypothetical protein [Alistipes sp.]
MAKEKKPLHPGQSLAIGLAIGLGFGVAMDNIPIGICIGVALGAAYSTNAWGKENKKDKE